MSRRPSTIQTADVRRILRAAKEEGWPSVTITAGHLTIVASEGSAPNEADEFEAWSRRRDARRSKGNSRRPEDARGR